MPTISLHFNKEEDQLFRDYAKHNGLTINEFLRKSALEKIESEIDLKLYNKAIEEFEENSTIYSHEDVLKELDL
ncbi:type II toxin-antitoxin system RelB family antitoxin [Xylocopilactobacillus apicola]|uniref:CopG family transcriptional regulator n=1 Tax=Xylocopilactobacillus apicola TaxID=2932184 RepID=A0AAU9D5C0_9LACO|nr:DUF6290 family protein [Xylocopilactobacillus apicola]BDR57671.1 CopG family transcriptional regulator [Xylocopilactobacillus apicola]